MPVCANLSQNGRSCAEWPILDATVSFVLRSLDRAASPLPAGQHGTAAWSALGSRTVALLSVPAVRGTLDDGNEPAPVSRRRTTATHQLAQAYERLLDVLLPAEGTVQAGQSTGPISPATAGEKFTRLHAGHLHEPGGRMPDSDGKVRLNELQDLRKVTGNVSFPPQITTDFLKVIPMYNETLFVKNIVQTLSQSMMRYKIVLQLGNYCGKRITDLVFDPVCNVSVLDWWTPQYYNEIGSPAEDESALADTEWTDDSDWDN